MMSVIVFCDSSYDDANYEELIRAEFRRVTGWKVLADTPIYNQLTEFAKRYAKKQRSPSEVVTIFRLAIGASLPKLDQEQFKDVFPTIHQSKSKNLPEAE